MTRRYGARLPHLLGHAALAVVAGYALARAFQTRVAPEPLNLLAWLVGGALLHDLVLLPAYSALDRAVQRVAAPPLLNHVRVPLVLSGVVLLVYAPSILDRQPGNVTRALGAPRPDYLGRWLGLTAALLIGSALLYAVRAARAARASRADP